MVMSQHGKIVGYLALVLALSQTLKAENVTLAWDASTDPEIAGYRIYYGSESGVYTNSVSVGITNAVSLSDLVGGVTYYFAATSYTEWGLESAYSSEASYAVPAAVPGQAITNLLVLQGVSVRLAVASSAGTNLTYTLEPGAPEGVRIDEATGILTWSPTLSQASTTNTILVRVTDNNDATLTRLETVVVTVQDCLKLTLGSTSTKAGQSGVLPIQLHASEPLSSVAFTVNWPSDRLFEPTLTTLPPEIASSRLINQGTNLLIQMETAPGQVLSGTVLLAELNFRTDGRQGSAFISLPVAEITGTKPSAMAFNNYKVGDGEVTVVNQAPLLRSDFNSSGRLLTVYGEVGTRYEVQCASSAVAPVWVPVTTFTQTNITQTLVLDSSEPVVFCRLMAK